MQSHLLIATIEYTDESAAWAGNFGIEQLNFELTMKSTFGGNERLTHIAGCFIYWPS